MLTYFIRRFLLIIPTMLGITLIAFMVTRFVPGGPLDIARMEAQQASLDKSRESGGGQDALSKEQMEILAKFYGFDQPPVVAYLQWLGAWPREKIDPEAAKDAAPKKVFSGLIQLDFGNSFRHSEKVWDVMMKRFPVSLYFGLVTFFLTYLVCIPLGIMKAMHHKRALDNASSVLIFVGYAIPGYVFGILLLHTFAFKMGWFAHSGFVSENFATLSFWGKTVDLWKHTALPLACYLISSFAVLTMLMKNKLMDNLAADYVRTAMAKGISFQQSVLRHAFRNSLVPIATGFGHLVGVLISGSFLIERVFDINGFGLLGFSAVVDRDYPLMMGILFLSSLLMLLGNIISDMCVALVDPRIRFGE